MTTRYTTTYIYILLDWDEGYDKARDLPSATVFSSVEEAKASKPGYDWYPPIFDGTINCIGVPYSIRRIEGVRRESSN